MRVRGKLLQIVIIVQDFLKMGKERENSYQKWRDLRRKDTHKHTDTYLKYFNDLRSLS